MVDVKDKKTTDLLETEHRVTVWSNGRTSGYRSKPYTKSKTKTPYGLEMLRAVHGKGTRAY